MGTSHDIASHRIAPNRVPTTQQQHNTTTMKFFFNLQSLAFFSVVVVDPKGTFGGEVTHRQLKASKAPEEPGKTNTKAPKTSLLPKASKSLPPTMAPTMAPKYMAPSIQLEDPPKGTVE